MGGTPRGIGAAEFDPNATFVPAADMSGAGAQAATVGHQPRSAAPRPSRSSVRRNWFLESGRCLLDRSAFRCPPCRDPSGSARSPRPPCRAHGGAVQRRPAPVEPVRAAQPLEQRPVERRPDPGLLHPTSRRQHVLPPQPISAGRSRHWMQVCSTKTIPASAARSDTRGLPPFGLAGSDGRNGETAAQRSSGTRGAAIAPGARAERDAPRARSSGR